MLPEDMMVFTSVNKGLQSEKKCTWIIQELEEYYLSLLHFKRMH